MTDLPRTGFDTLKKNYIFSSLNQWFPNVLISACMHYNPMLSRVTWQHIELVTVRTQYVQ
jgi:hypothetical protein